MRVMLPIINVMDAQLPLAIAILVACMLAGWFAVRGGWGGRNLIALLLVAVTALQVLRLYAGF